MSAPPALDTLRFDNRFLRELPQDPVTINHVRRVGGAAYSRVEPSPVAKPKLLAYSREVATALGLDESAVLSTEFAQVFAGNRVLPGMETYATCYGGHQFGHWAQQLGDGRVIALGEALDRNGQRQELQLKGAGPTPYSRSGDGRAVLRSSLREFLCSEAMHHLGVPTTRALSLVTSGELVSRDMFYDGRPALEPGAIVCRVAPSFTRFGHFELPASRGDETLLRRWVEHTIRAQFPELVEPGAPISVPVILRWLAEVARRTAVMIIGWMRVGFVHGVMNTDNMSVLGLTIDYGPYGWVDDYDPNWTPNTTDAGGRRYCFGAQPQIAFWNLARLADALLPMVKDVDAIPTAIETYATTFDVEHLRMQREKIGLPEPRAPRPEATPQDDPDIARLVALFELMATVETDMTIFYRRLALVPTRADATDGELLAPLAAAWYKPPIPDAHRAALLAWLRSYAERLRQLGINDGERRARMDAVNPKYVLRNYMAQVAIDAAAKDDASVVNELLEVLRRPYDDSPEHERWAGRRPDWARDRPGCSMLSCSS